MVSMEADGLGCGYICSTDLFYYITEEPLSQQEIMDLMAIIKGELLITCL